MSDPNRPSKSSPDPASGVDTERARDAWPAPPCHPPWDDFAQADGPRSILKRTIDLGGALVVLTLLTPLILVTALLVRLDSPGPILSRELSRGYRGRLFRILRFRTSVGGGEPYPECGDPGNPSSGGQPVRQYSSPQIAHLGRFLRRYGLDELPQFINVLCGEMSLVGPRPLSIAESDRLREQDQQVYEYRLTAMPGVTGAWQVAWHGDSNHTQMIKCDVDYIENWSLGWDLRIIGKTVIAMLLRR